jgi:hypothetical protein
MLNSTIQPLRSCVTYQYCALCIWYTGFDILMAVNIKIIVFWNMILHSLLVAIDQTAQCHIPEDCNLKIGNRFYTRNSGSEHKATEVAHMV